MAEARVFVGVVPDQTDSDRVRQSAEVGLDPLKMAVGSLRMTFDQTIGIR